MNKVETIMGLVSVISDHDRITKRIIAKGRLDYDPVFGSLVKRGDLVIDVGAYIGDSTKGFINAGAHVIAFEPYPDAFECLRQNCPQAWLINCAAGDGQVYELEKIKPAENYGGRRCVPRKRGANYKSARDAGDVGKSMMIDSLRLDHVDLIKIDAEGWDLQVLGGAFQTIKRCLPTIMVEVCPSGLKHLGHEPECIREWMNMMVYDIEVLRGTDSGDHLRDYLCKPKQ